VRQVTQRYKLCLSFIFVFLFFETMEPTDNPFATLKSQLQQNFDTSAREVIVTLLDATPVEKEKLRKSEYELVRFLERSRYISEKDVSPFLKVVNFAKDPSLSLILHLLVDYQPSPSVHDNPNGKDILLH
jgi:hypothetical protein